MLAYAYPAAATFAFGLLLTGFALRARGPVRHAALMGIGMAIDLVLVLTLELSKGAIGTALGPELTGPQRLHVGASSIAVALYFPVFALGWTRLFRPSIANLGLRTWHRRLGYGALFFRAIGFFFMFTILHRS